jgi:hypothetical protein
MAFRLRCFVLPLLVGGLGACPSLSIDVLPGEDGSASHDGGGGRDATRPHEAGKEGGRQGQETGIRDAGTDVGVIVDSAREASREAGPVCSGTQKSFGPALQGESNPGFTSGVATRDATQVIMFDGFEQTDGGTQAQIYAQAFDLATGAAIGNASTLHTPPAGAGLFLHDVATSPGGQIALLYGYGGFPKYGADGPGLPAIAGEGMLHALFLAPGSGPAGLGVVVDLDVGAGHRVYGQAHVIWDPGTASFIVSWEYMINVISGTDYYALGVSSYTSSGSPNGGTPVVMTNQENSYIAGGAAEQGSAAATGGVLGVTYLGLTNMGLPDLSLLKAGSAVGDVLLYGGTPVYPGWITAAGNPQGIVAVWNEFSGTFTGEFVPISPDGGAGALVSLSFTGPGATVGGRAVGDNGPGAVGLAVLSVGGLSFAYVPPSLTPTFGPDPEIAYSYAVGSTDAFNIASWGGSFVLGLYRGASHNVTAVVSGCTVP